MLRRRHYISIPIALALCCSSIPAQVRGTAGIYGKVTDAQGAVIPGAAITLTQVATNQVRNASANEVGDYQFPLIPVGEYRMLIEHPGFKKQEFNSILLQAGDNLKVDAQLAVGEVSTSVVVDASAVAVEASSSTLKATVDSTRIVELPLNGRNVATLTTLVAGVQPASGVTGEVGAGSRSANGAMQIAVNGSRQNNVKYTLDGGDNNDSLVNMNLTFPFPDAVQEFSFQTSNSGADIGRNSGGAVHVVTKSGTNELHGSGFWFVRNTALNANNFFSRSPDQLKRNQGGFTVGGPVIKNKLFLFGGFQRTWMRFATGSSRSATMNATSRAGDFSTNKIKIIDPLNGLPFPNNQVPLGRFSPVTQAVLKVYPVAGPDGFAYYSTTSKNDGYNEVARADYRPNDHHSILARWLGDDVLAPYKSDPNNINNVNNGNLVHSKNATVGDTWVLNPSMIADTHFTMSREVGDRPLDLAGSMADYGINFHPLSNQRNFSINGTSGLSIGGGNSPGIWARTNFELTHSWRWTKGRHNLVWGAELMTSRYNEYNMYKGAGDFQFDGRVTGLDQADFLLGYLGVFQQSNGEIEFRRFHYQAFYGGDSFRVNGRLTLDFGLRWEPFTPMTDLNNRVVQFRQDAFQQGLRSQRFVNAPPGLFYPGDSVNGYTIPQSGIEGGNKYFGPRAGFAWDVFGNGKTSIRGGYGMFYDMPMLFSLNNMNVQAPFSFTVRLEGGNTPGTIIPLANPFQGHESLNVFPFAGDFDRNSPFQLPFQAVVLPQKWVLPYTQQWNFTVERSFASSWLIRVGYVGSKATHLAGNYDMNAPIYDFSRTLSQNQSSVNARRPRAGYQQIYNMTFGLNSQFNSLQTTLNKRFSHGFSVLSAYTWSKNMDYKSTNNEASSSTLPDPFLFRFGRGVADNDHTHRWTNSFVWDLPDPGKAVRSNVLSAIVGGWQLSGIYLIQSGRPFSITSSNNNVAGAGTAMADLTGDLSMPGGRSRNDVINQFFNTKAIVQAANGTYGTLGRNVLRGPRFSNFDASMSKTVPLHFRESAKLEFRAEFFNLPNLPQLGLPNSRVGNTTFGRITGTDASPRILQFGLKLQF